MFVKALRVGLGHVIIAGDLLTRPRKKQRPAEQQAQVNAAAKDLTLSLQHNLHRGNTAQAELDTDQIRLAVEYPLNGMF